MGFVAFTSPCANCHQLIWNYNPVRVPSVRVNGKREPVCLACMTRFNEKRVAAGHPPVTIAADAYDAVDEQEVVWPDD